MSKTVAVLTTLDTKGAESQYLREQIEALGAKALLIDMGVIGAPGAPADISREEVAGAGGGSLDELLNEPTRQKASPVMIAGASAILRERIDAGSVHAVLGLGGTQGTSNCTQVMQALPYGFPKLMVSTVASGDTSAFVGIKDVTMAFSVGDILGLNPVTRKILANAAGAAYGMALTEVTLERTVSDKPVIGMTNLGVLTDGAMKALELFNAKGYEVIVFHAVGSGGLAMEQMMKEGLIGAVFDYALGEIADEVFDGLRAASPERLTVAGELGLPQVLVPGGAEHIGLIVEADTVPERYKDHIYTFHNPIIFAPRLNADEMGRVAQEIGARLQKTSGRAVFMIPRDGVSRYSAPGGPLRDPAGDAVFFDALRANLPAAVEVVELDTHAEDPAFVEQAVDRLVALIEGN
jgi:uncharacterized protein (UPF0261 family)